MRKVLLLIIGLLILSFGAFILLRIFGNPQKTNKAVLKLQSNPEATLFINNQHVGKTPYEEYVTPGEYTLKLIPDSTLDQIVSWEGKVTLTTGLLTYINRELGDKELTSAGEILQLEKISGNKAEVVVVSTPDGATVTLDGTEKGATPLIIDAISTGEHELTVSALGSVSRTVRIRATNGYKLTASFQLAISDTALPLSSPSPSASASASPKSSPKPSSTPHIPTKPYVKILDTPTGFLRVRQAPSTAATESARVKPGEYYPFKDEQNEWFKIEYEAGKLGWISSKYAQKFE